MVIFLDLPIFPYFFHVFPYFSGIVCLSFPCFPWLFWGEVTTKGRVHLMGHGAGADLTRHDLLLEVLHGDVPHGWL